MGFGALRSLIRPVSRALLPVSHFSSATRTLSIISSPELRYLSPRLRHNIPWIPPHSAFHSLTDTRYPKRRPSDKPCRKKASLKPPGPYVWVKYVPGEPILPNQPNEGSKKRRNKKKRIKQHRAFIMGFRADEETKVLGTILERCMCALRERASNFPCSERYRIVKDMEKASGLCIC